ncbi:MAG TPA: tetratricopeptide repeat protein, partial [Chloroflexota bacterium]|nr:tetratricopeptide repeat protein [Chloroflexota bacterium]
IARTLGIAAAPGESSAATLVAALGGRQLLLLLDNCEHLVEASAQLAEDILQHCPGARILATSREALEIPGEVRRGVPPLAVPPDDAALPLGEVTRYAAARLFIDRARAVLPTFEPREGEARALARLCRRLDGIPLAIELAAAQVAVLSVQQIEARLDQRFQLLLGGSRTALPRHQTLSALVAWSYDLLGEAERRVFERLSVFTGTFSLEAIEEVGGGADIAPAAVVPLLARLVGKSLVVAEPDAAGSPCYRLLETLRQFGWERLAAAGQAEEAAERHARHYLALAQAGERGMRGPDQVEWLQRLDAEHDNLRAGLAWLERNGQIPAALRLAGSLTLFWAIRGYYSEGRAHLERLLAYDRATENYPERGKALWGIGTLAARQGDTDVLRSCFEESLACATRAGDRLTIIGAAIGLARCEADTNLGRARDWLTIALGHALAVGDRSSLAAILITRSILAAHEGQIVAAQTIAEEAVAMSREIGDAWQLGWALHFAAAFVLARGDYATARARFEEMLKLARALGDRSTIANALTYLGQVAVEEHTPEGASARFAEALAIYRDRGDQAGIVLAASRLAGVYLAEGDVNLARSLAEESLLASADAGTHSRAVALLGRGDVALAAGDVAAARQYFVEGLSLLDLAGPVGPIAQFLLALARVAAARNQQRRALRLIGRADTAPGWPPLRPASVDRHLLDQALARLQAEAGGLTAEEQLAARAEGAAMTTGQAVGYALAADGD